MFRRYFLEQCGPSRQSSSGFSIITYECSEWWILVRTSAGRFNTTIPISVPHGDIGIGFPELLGQADDVLAIYSKIPRANTNNQNCGGCISGTF
jgi:hypothetical protein